MKEDEKTVRGADGAENPAPIGTKYEKRRVRSAIPIWIAASVWALAALSLPLYRIWAIIVTALLSAVMAGIAVLLLPRETKNVAVPFASGNTELDAMVNEINRAMSMVDEDREALNGAYPETEEKMADITETMTLIREDIIKDTDDIRLIRRFMNYYLPMTIKLCDKYVFLADQQSGPNVETTRRDIEDALGVVRSAFRKQYDALFANDALDISTDVKVLEAMISRDRLD
jgi:hypothetical protein